MDDNIFRQVYLLCTKNKQFMCTFHVQKSHEAKKNNNQLHYHVTPLQQKRKENKKNEKDRGKKAREKKVIWLSSQSPFIGQIEKKKNFKKQKKNRQNLRTTLLALVQISPKDSLGRPHARQDAQAHPRVLPVQTALLVQAPCPVPQVGADADDGGEIGKGQRAGGPVRQAGELLDEPGVGLAGLFGGLLLGVLGLGLGGSGIAFQLVLELLSFCVGVL